MHSPRIHSNHAASFVSRIVRALSGMKGELIDAFAAACAAEIREHRSLAKFVASVASQSRRDRAVLLLEAASELRTDDSKRGVADTLCRMARKPGLYHAVLCSLSSQTAMAQAA